MADEEFIEIEQPDSAGDAVIQDGTSTTYAVTSNQVEEYPISPTNAEDFIEEASINDQVAFATGDMTYAGGPPSLPGPNAAEESITTDILPGLPQLGTNLFDKSKETQVSFVYQITKVESTFSKGRFTQDLHGVLVPFNTPPTTKPKAEKISTKPVVADTDKNPLKLQSVLTGPPKTPEQTAQWIRENPSWIQTPADISARISNGTFRPAEIYTPLIYGDQVTPLQKQWVKSDVGVSEVRKSTQNIVRDD